ncbi:protein obstructor-E-like [Pectinophora gossypiella]|uniref:protein obstructor-E-like n=1 Tax=Pectinophora gossypiella TaxID=13191 RepID=UPI00214E7321|nr:protein obstructor-E-like [Pectinophora gossypiella]
MFKYLSLAVILGAACAAQAASVELQPRNPLCTERNGYFSVEGKCDSYIECRDFSANEMLCPDGLHYNPRAAWPDYPCGYPSDVSCEGRGVPQPALPTAECPHEYGFFPSQLAQPEAGHCGQYRMCVAGVAIEMMCPPGLAFNPDNARCDWPDLVPSCKVEAYLGFQCPPAPLGENGEPLEVVNYKFEDNCYAFYSCEHGKPRLLSCDEGLAFDAASGHCVDADKVACAGNKAPFVVA